MDLPAHFRPQRHPWRADVLHKEARILHISRSITSPAPPEEWASFYNLGAFVGAFIGMPINAMKNPTKPLRKPENAQEAYWTWSTRRTHNEGPLRSQSGCNAVKDLINRPYPA
jgi:hypothetical protein